MAFAITPCFFVQGKSEQVPSAERAENPHQEATVSSSNIAVE